MRKCSLPVILLLALLVVPAAATAQERGQTGLVMGFPVSFGVIWHASDRLAVRPEVSFTHTSQETQTNFISGSSESNSDAFTVGASVLWYLAKSDNIRTYVAPRFTYGQLSTDIPNTGAPATEADAFSITGSFGAQYTPARKFAVFGEIGYGLSRTKSTFSSNVTTAESTSRAWATRGAVGVIFYFGG